MDSKYTLINDIDEKEARALFEWIDTLPDKSTATIDILSHGGLCFVGTGVAQRILEAQTHGIRFIARVYGICASAASDIALACNEIRMAMGSQILIHSAWNEYLDADDEGIKRANSGQLALIRRKMPNYTEDDLKQDRWFGVEEAVKAGLCNGYIKLDEVMATLHKVAARYNSMGGMDMKKDKMKAELDTTKMDETPCTDEEKKNEEPKALDDDIMTIDVLEQMAQRLEKIEERLAVLEGEGKKADDEGADMGENGDQIAARLNSLYARLSGGKADEKPVVATTGKVSKQVKMEASFERSKKIDLKSFM